jgi:uncharacterized coiled-coil protein SlyX
VSDAQTRIERLEAAISVQQVLIRTLAELLIEHEISSASDWRATLRNAIDRWHELIDSDRTTSKTAASLQEQDREMARQMTDGIFSQIDAWAQTERGRQKGLW